MDSVVQLAHQHQLTTAEAKKGAWAAGSRRARWQIVEIVFWKGRGATSHSRSTRAKKICPSKPFSLDFAGLTKQKRWKGYRSSALCVGFAAHPEHASCARRNKLLKGCLSRELLRRGTSKCRCAHRRA